MKTLKQLREEAYLKADIPEESAAIDTTLANLYVNEAWCELYDIIISADDARTFALNAQITTSLGAGTHGFLLPERFYHMCSVHVLRNNVYIPAIQADPSQYAELADDTSDLGQPRYFIREDADSGVCLIYVFPEPSVEALAFTYFPEPKLLEDDADALSNRGQRLEFVTNGAAIRMLQKVERDPSDLQKMQTACFRRITDTYINRDFNNPRRIRDISYRFGFDG